MPDSSKKTRVLFFRPSLARGGADRVTVTVMQHLDRSLYDVELVLLQKTGPFVEEVPDDVTIHELGGRVWTSVPPLLRLLRQRQPDVLFSTSSGTNVPAAMAKFFLRDKVRVVVSERNMLEHGNLTPKRRLMIWLKKMVYPQADQITALSEGVKRDMVEKLGLAPERISVLYNPVVDDDLPVAAAAPLDHPWFVEGAPPVILGVGRLVPQKDFATLIRAFARVRAEREARLLILGEGPLRSDLEALVEDLGLTGDVLLPGFDKNPFRYMARSALFVLSSIHEGLGNVIIQSMACGLPVISTNCPSGPDEIITHEEDGLLIPMRDPDTLADAILHLLGHPEEKAALAQKARRSAQRFRVEAVIGNYVAAVRKAAGTDQESLLAMSTASSPSA